MKKKLYAYWWRQVPNLGDALTPYIISKLSGIEVHHIGVRPLEAMRELYSCIRNLKKPRRKSIFPLYLHKKKYIVGVGSILNFAPSPECVIWGSGFVHRKEGFKGGQVVAVRGRFTDEKLQSHGVPATKVYGDPALLLPVIYKSERNQDKLMAIIPNYNDYDFFKEKYGDRFDIIDLRSSDVEDKLNEILQFQYILSTSLHGLIIGHAYGIPALWIEHSVLAGDSEHFKFRDYLSSVNVDYYEPFHDITDILQSDIEQYFREHSDKIPSLNKIKEIQHNLLKVAPFPLLDKYRVQ